MFFTCVILLALPAALRGGRERSTLRLKVTYLVAELGFEPCWLTPEHTHLILRCDKLSELLIS